MGELNSLPRTGGPVHKPICQSRIFEKELRTLPELDRLVVDYQSISLTVYGLLYVRMKVEGV